MRGAKNMLNYWRHLAGNKTLVAFLFAITAIIVGAAAMLYTQNTAQAANCSANDIVRCGVSSGGDFQSKYNQNATGDLPAIYAAYGVNAGEVASKAVAGTAYRDGTIKVGGRTVATGAYSLGRSGFSYASPQQIGGKTYYRSQHTDVLNSDVSVLVVMDGNNQFKYAVIKACGNPVGGHPTPPPKPPKPPKPPVYECTDLRKIRMEDEENESSQRAYQFELTSSAANGAELQSVEFDFGNGETQTVDADSETVTSRSVVYDEAGDYEITTMLNFIVSGKLKTITDENCTESVTVPKPKEIVVCREGEIITIPEDEKLDTDLPEDSEECQPTPPPKEEKPPVIPSTGPAEVISGIAGMGGLAGAGYYFRNSRRNLLSTVFKK